MTRNVQVGVISGAIYVVLFAFAFVSAPHSCQWGFPAYFWIGVAAFCTLMVLPIAFLKGSSISRRIALGIGLAAISAGLWVAGLLSTNMQILCRLW